MASLDEIAKALSLNKTDSKTDTLLGKVTSADPFTVQVQGNTIECLDFCGAGTGDVVVLQKLKNGTVAAISKAGGGGVPSGGTTGQSLVKNSSTSGDADWWGDAIELEEVTDYVVPAFEADYVVAQGTSGIWTYRKWNSGIAECWGITTEALTITYALGSIYYVQGTTISLPSELFTTAPVVNASVSSNTTVWTHASAVTSSSFTIRYFNGTQITSAATIQNSVIVIGAWK